MTSLEVGSEAPEFFAAAPDLSPVTNATFAGKTAVLSFFPAAFSGGAEEGCEMQLCSMSSLAASADKDRFVFYGVSGDLPFANSAFAKKIDICYPLVSDPTLATCARYVGKCAFGAFLKEVGMSSALDGTMTTSRGCVVVGPDGKVLYAFSGGEHPGKQPDMDAIRKIIV